MMIVLKPQPVVRPPDKVLVELEREEAELLFLLAGAVHGPHGKPRDGLDLYLLDRALEKHGYSPSNFRRDLTDRLYDRLHEVLGIEW